MNSRWIWGLTAVAFLSFDVWLYHTSTGWLKRLMAFWGHDLFLATFFFFLNRAVTQQRLNRSLYVAAFVLCGTAAFEFAQLARIYPGTFDPLDFVAYLGGVILALGVDAVVLRRAGCLSHYRKRQRSAAVQNLAALPTLHEQSEREATLNSWKTK